MFVKQKLVLASLLAALVFSNLMFITEKAEATNVTFSQAFTQNATASSTAVSAWEAFRSRLTGSYNSFTWSSTNGASITVSDETRIQTIANALRTGSSTDVVIGSNTWSIGTGCGSPAGYSVAVEFSNQGRCSCASGYNLRPLIGNSNWGGSNGTTCGATSQTITLTFFTSAPDTTAPTFTSSSSFSVAENIATSSNAATIKVSESSTVTISSGSDAALFNIITSDSVTAFIRFKASPNFEAPADVGGNNVYEITLRAVDAATNAGTQAITIIVTDVVDTSAFNSLVLSGAATFRQLVTITANVSVASRVTFRARNIIISGCKNKLTSGSSPNIVATCSWRPSMRGAVVITATAVPTGAGISSASATPVNVVVGGRSGAR